MKRNLILVFCIAALLSILTTGTMAYHVSYGVSDNVITAGNIRLELHNCTADGSPVPDGGAMACLPGSCYSRVVTAENTGDHPMYLRLSVSKYVQDSTLPAGDCLNLDIDSVNWQYKDGYYYYLKALAPGETSTPLFTQVEIDGENVDNQYLGKTLMLDVCAYGVQSENNAEDVMSAVGWPEA